MAVAARVRSEDAGRIEVGIRLEPSARKTVAAEAQASGLWQTASRLWPSGPMTKAP